MIFLKSLYIAPRFYFALFVVAILYTVGFFVDAALALAQIAAVGLIVICVADFCFYLAKTPE